MKTIFSGFLSLLLLLLFSGTLQAQKEGKITFSFDGNLKSEAFVFTGQNPSFEEGIDGQSLSLKDSSDFNNFSLDQISLNGTEDFTIQFWIKTTSENPTVLLSQKAFTSKGTKAQKEAGWALYSSNGTFAWAIGSGSRRLNYERDNGHKMPLNDGRWHMLTMTFSKERSEIRLYYDGHNKAIYKVGFQFANTEPLRIGAQKSSFNYENQLLPDIRQGAALLQELVDEFNDLDIQELKEDELLSLITDPKALYIRKTGLARDKASSLLEENTGLLDQVFKARDSLLSNPYTIFQNKELTKLKPVSKLYSLKGRRIEIDQYQAELFTAKEQLFSADFAMDELAIWHKALHANEVLAAYNEYRQSTPFNHKSKTDSLTVAVWNIWHGGKHFTVERNDWDSRMRIAEMIRAVDADVVLMQETYSSGDFIAAELGYYFATSADWDYRSQGSNISVLSRYPIEALDVPVNAEFMNVSARLAISENQEIYAMSNWYGMASFEQVFDFHKERFAQSDVTPVLFGGDFNAVPHTDGGDSPASVKMLNNGFTDAYRSLHPDVATFPGITHQWGDRIDQLYYKGAALENLSTEVISTWFGGFPSDHFMILSRFKLNK